MLNYFYPARRASTQSAYIERLKGIIRRELLNAYIFHSLDDVKEIVEKCMVVTITIDQTRH